MAAKKYAIVFVEGETEKAMFNDFKTLHGYPIKKIVIANLWHVSINRLLPALTEKSEILIVFDTDRLENIDRFKANLKLLKSKKHSIHLFQQNDNFEKELAHACSITPRRLYSAFCPKIVSSDNFKNEFIALRNRMARLENLNINKDLLWERDLIIQINEFRQHHSSHRKYFT
ncbi:hypothetical protein [Citrobacter portucalensis]|uniref:hypothetical protein n=1 Tax=Citrobacter portucalensis TaxID=1639133 RepID=UPI00194DDEB2|nr:hypothetical protein [Citrobacter portucalensis]EGT0022805.1 RloB domain-containing protein [Citrobacter freundii]EGT0458417.1 RloB domain-containing protein [Citrobacter freundii]MBJ9836135.1 hypothetical protein [Citrobacter freundii]MBM6611270.1 hypothetical protein [Citrobacter portucalensis]